MPQIILPVENKSKNSGARALGNMRSRRSRVTRTSKTGRNSVSSAVKNQCLRLPALPSARTTPQDPLNQSQRAIASVERWPSQAIPIVRDSDVPEFLDRTREQRSGLVPLAIEAVRYSLQVKKDARISIKILRDLWASLRTKLGARVATKRNAAGE